MRRWLDAADRGALAVAGVVLAARLVYAHYTGYVLDDALITARYGRNLAEGFGFSFNPGVPSYGFTSPLWVVIAAAGHLLGAPAHGWLAGLALLCDAGTAYLAARMIPSFNGRLALGALLASWPVLNASSVGGMETGLLALLAVAWWSRRAPGWAAALAPLVRPEGWFLTVAHGIRERQPIALVAWLPGLAWMAFAWAQFGAPVPLSAEAKRLVYGGPSPELAIAWLYHLGQLPLFQVRPLKTTMVVASLTFWLAASAASPGGRGWGLGLALAWFAFLIVTGAPIFEWYLALPTVLLIVTACRSEILQRWRVGAAAIALNAAFLFVWGLQDGAAQRRLVDHTWAEATEYVSEIPDVDAVFAEAVGVLGWEFRGRVYDEVGIVTPGMGAYREGGDGWYLRAVEALRPDALLVRPYYLYRNEALSGPDRPFTDEGEFHRLGRDYVEVAAFTDTSAYATPRVAEVRVLLRRNLARARGIVPRGALNGEGEGGS